MYVCVYTWLLIPRTHRHMHTEAWSHTTHPLTCPHTHPHTLTYSHTHSLTLTHTHTHSHSHTLTHTHSLTHIQVVYIHIQHRNRGDLKISLQSPKHTISKLAVPHKSTLVAGYEGFAGKGWRFLTVHNWGERWVEGICSWWCGD